MKHNQWTLPPNPQKSYTQWGRKIKIHTTDSRYFLSYKNLFRSYLILSRMYWYCDSVSYLFFEGNIVLPWEIPARFALFYKISLKSRVRGRDFTYLISHLLLLENHFLPFSLSAWYIIKALTHHFFLYYESSPKPIVLWNYNLCPHLLLSPFPKLSSLKEYIVCWQLVLDFSLWWSVCMSASLTLFQWVF
jgi:hypothetical protein